MINIRIFIFFGCHILLGLNVCYGQAINIIDKLPIEAWSRTYKGEVLNVERKMELLALLPSNEKIEFVMNSDWHNDELMYFDLDTSGLIYMDLDFDGDLDLLYSSVNAAMMQTATKVYYNTNNILNYEFTLRDGVLDIKKNKSSYQVFTLFRPCCDSYTTRIEEYVFSKHDRGEFQQSISIIGRTYRPFRAMIDFNGGKTFSDTNITLLALQSDFRGVSPYFRELNKEVKAELRENGVIKLLKINGEVSYQVIDSTTYKGVTYSLIITKPLNNLPKMPISLYEWSQGDKRRLVGWIKK